MPQIPETSSNAAQIEYWNTHKPADLGHEFFDAAFSRFGVMFFSDPVAAFANIRASLKPDGRLAFVCWRPLNENPWMEPRCKPHFHSCHPLRRQIPRRLDRLRDPNRVRSILADSAYGSVTINPFDADIGGGDLEQTLKLASGVGPLGRALREHPELADNVVDSVRNVLSNYLTSTGVRMPGAVWIVLAHPKKMDRISERTPRYGLSDFRNVWLGVSRAIFHLISWRCVHNLAGRSSIGLMLPHEGPSR
jgi:hypothetical protein